MTDLNSKRLETMWCATTGPVCCFVDDDLQQRCSAKFVVSRVLLEPVEYASKAASRARRRRQGCTTWLGRRQRALFVDVAPESDRGIRAGKMTETGALRETRQDGSGKVEEVWEWDLRDPDASTLFINVFTSSKIVLCVSDGAPSGWLQPAPPLEVAGEVHFTIEDDVIPKIGERGMLTFHLIREGCVRGRIELNACVLCEGPPRLGGICSAAPRSLQLQQPHVQSRDQLAEEMVSTPGPLFQAQLPQSRMSHLQTAHGGNGNRPSHGFVNAAPLTSNGQPPAFNSQSSRGGPAPRAMTFVEGQGAPFRRGGELVSSVGVPAMTRPLEATPAIARDGLRHHTVPAVATAAAERTVPPEGRSLNAAAQDGYGEAGGRWQHSTQRIQKTQKALDAALYDKNYRSISNLFNAWHASGGSCTRRAKRQSYVI